MSSEAWWAMVKTITAEHRKIPSYLRRMSGVHKTPFHADKLPPRSPSMDQKDIETKLMDILQKHPGKFTPEDLFAHAKLKEPAGRDALSALVSSGRVVVGKEWKLRRADTPMCAASIEGPKVGRRVVAWRRACRSRPMKGKHYCAAHKYLER